mmetsp:Transcript_1861/g.3823  ORF Transcript_1861/g.3823 Transcript_1861/m.3823 type:complete len:150 (-) Transcript_1861:23-472(-)
MDLLVPVQPGEDPADLVPQPEDEQDAFDEAFKEDVVPGPADDDEDVIGNIQEEEKEGENVEEEIGEEVPEESEPMEEAAHDQDFEDLFDKPPLFDAPASPPKAGAEKKQKRVANKRKLTVATASRQGRRATPCALCGQAGHVREHCHVL